MVVEMAITEKLRIKPPFCLPHERWLVLGVLVGLVLMPFLFRPSRADLLAKIPPSEANAAFLIREIYENKEPLDLVVIGPCTAWWSVDTVEVARRLQEKWQRPVRVANLGHNHFGSDVDFLILSDLLANRSVKNVVLTLPKKQDVQRFPHQNAASWWVYPWDLEGVSDLSLESHVRLFGLSVFSSLGRLQGGRARVFQNPADDGFGFNLSRMSERDEFPLPADSGAGHVGVRRIAEIDEKPALSRDWLAMFEALALKIQKSGVHVIFLDSPHQSDLLGHEDTTAWGFERLFPSDVAVIEPRFVEWWARLRDQEKDRMLMGSNLSVYGARAFTRMISDALIQEARE